MKTEKIKRVKENIQVQKTIKRIKKIQNKCHSKGIATKSYLIKFGIIKKAGSLINEYGSSYGSVWYINKRYAKHIEDGLLEPYQNFSDVWSQTQYKTAKF